MTDTDAQQATVSPATVALARAYGAGLASVPVVVGIFLVAVFWRPLAVGWPVVVFPLLVVAAGEPARRVLADVCGARVALIGAYAFSTAAVGLALIVVATAYPLAIIAWLGCLPAWAAVVHQTLHVEARPPRPPITTVRWRDIMIALLLGLAAAVPAVVVAGIGVLLLALAGSMGHTGPSNSTIIFCLALLELLVVAAVTGGVVFALRRFTSRAVAVGAALGIGTSAGVILYWLVDSHRPLTVALTACFVLVWLLVGRWWLNTHAKPARSWLV
jgi:hypothetical protein